ncbi:hypothetical protein SVIO_053450 [Streptomyces violaceusniger]|uniref:Uncharacterized protein n=1 Tax=Streptomyces violaceusniger TaxID=68280 RepID=A0A4D4L0X5_STRVO|nr:hypothetical protein SVIO_053450 [Streptomyces violaceusniger]
MGLTSNNIVIAAAVAALLLFAATIWLWPRLAGRGVAPVLGRVGMLLGTQLTVFMAFGLFANQSFGFYGSWSDLLGTQDEPGVVVDHDTRVPGCGSPRPATWPWTAAPRPRSPGASRR